MVPDEYQYLVDERDDAVATLEGVVEQRNCAVQERDEIAEKLAEAERHLAWLKRQMFGQTSERFVDPDPNQPELELNLEPPTGEKADETTVPEHKRKKKRRSTGVDSLKWADDVPVEEDVVDVPEEDRRCARTGDALEIIGEDVVDRLARRPGSCYVKRTRYLKRANPKDPKSGMVRALAKPSILPGGKFDESLLAWIIVEKFGFYQPLYRIAEKLKLEGVQVSRQTLSKVVLTIGEKLQPLYEEMRRKTLANRCLHVDETPIKLQQKGKCKQCYVWLYLAADPNAPPYHIYEFCDDRSQKHARKFLSAFNGTIHADAWSGYVAMDAEHKLKWSACWAHARRKFENAEDGDSELRTFVMRRMQLLFLLERRAWSRATPELRMKTRTLLAKPLVEDLFERVGEYRAKLMPKSAMGGACDYLLRYRKNFERYLDDPDLRMDNNPAERGLRKLVLGRKNFIFVGSPKAGHSMAGLLSLVQTCRAAEVNPFDYLEDVMRRILDHNSQQLHELLPDQWAAARKREQ